MVRRNPSATHPLARPSWPWGGLLLVAAAAVGSACGESRRATSLPPQVVEGSRVDVFLRAGTLADQEVLLDLESVQLRDARGEQFPLSLRRGTFTSTDVAAQITLAGAPVPPGTYSALVVTVREARVERDGRLRSLRLITGDQPQAAGPAPADEPPVASDQPAVDYELPVSLDLGKRDAASVFLEWNVAASLVGEDGFRFALGAQLEVPTLRLGVLYVADASTGTVLTVNRGSGQVVSTAAAGPGARALALSADGSRIFAANAGDGSLSILDARQGWSRSVLPIQLSAGTSDVALVDDGTLVAAASPGIDTVSIFDARLFARVLEFRVGRAPVRLESVPELQRLFVIESVSDRLSVIDVGSRALVASIPVESSPSAIAADRHGRLVFVGHADSPNLLAFDTQNLAQSDPIHVGRGVSAMLADVRRDRVYVARTRPNEIVIVDLRLRAAVRRIPVSGRIEGLAQPLEGSLIYGAAPDLGALIVVNTTRGREMSPIPCGIAPYDVVTTD